ncbi:MAG: VanW family protein [Lachnospiraceae bacterium]|nr:VanW family protein [Lachnospiraceae bacterium]
MKKLFGAILCAVLMTVSGVPVFAQTTNDILNGAGAGAGTMSSTVQDTVEDQSETSSATGSGAVVPVSQTASYTENDVIKNGVFAGPIELSGMTASNAESAIRQYIGELAQTNITLSMPNEKSVNVTARDLGLVWDNTGIIDEAMSLGKTGNIIKRFKDISDLKRTNKVFPIEVSVDDATVRQVLTEQCAVYDSPAEDATLKREDGSFIVEGGHTGTKLNVESSAKVIRDYFTSSFNGSGATLEMVVETDYPQGDPETLSKVKDVLGTFTTKFTSSGKDRVTNVSNGCSLVNGRTVYPGQQISVLDCITPFTEENGYALAGSYLNGVVVESFGGGICQVSTTLYQAVLRAELQVDERHNHSMVVNYVDHSGDAAIAESSGKDFKFTNNSEYPIYIDGYTSPEKTITFTIYGVETRPSNRSLEFESVDLETTEPVGEKVVADSSQPAGYAKGQSAHVGYKSEFWKIVKENGQETDRVKVNSSTYKAVPATLTMGTATSNPVTSSAISSAIATQSIDYCKAVAASVKMDGGASALAQQAALAALPADVEVAAENTATDQPQTVTPEATQ